MALNGVASDVQVEAGLAALAKRTVVLFRRHTGSYALWEGSDIDIDDRLLAARQSVERDQNLATFLTKQVPPQPLIARRHYFQTGTLRYYEAVYCSVASFHSDLFAGVSGQADDADGRILYFLPQDTADREALRAFIDQSAPERSVLAALPQDISDLRELCHDLLCLRWVNDHTPELDADPTARRELRARMAIAEQQLRNHLEWVFSPGNPGCDWFLHGKTVSLSTARQLNDMLSQACTEVYSSTPVWRNELINRRALSSSAAAASRNLIETMFSVQTFFLPSLAV